MAAEALPCHLLPISAGLAVVTVGIDGETAAGQEFTPDFYVFGIHELYQVFHDYIYTVFVEIAVVPEGEQV